MAQPWRKQNQSLKGSIMDVDQLVRTLQETYERNRAELSVSLEAAEGTNAKEHQEALMEMDSKHATMLRSCGFTVEGGNGPIQMEQHDRQVS
jgi:hypothetical protein